MIEVVMMKTVFNVLQAYWDGTGACPMTLVVGDDAYDRVVREATNQAYSTRQVDGEPNDPWELDQLMTDFGLLTIQRDRSLAGSEWYLKYPEDGE